MSPRATSIRALLLAGAAAAAFVPAPGWAAGAAPVATAVTPRPAFAAVPGPDAEYLWVTDRYTVRADGTVVHERDSRLQVNSSLAINRKYGETKVEWDPAIETCEVLTDRTVLPSGEVVAAPANAVVDDQPPGAERDPLWSGLRRKVIVHTGLEPGAVIEESWRVTRAQGAMPWFEFSAPIAFEPPARVRVVEVELPAATPFVCETAGWPAAEPSRESREGREVWRWRFDNVPAQPAQPGASAPAIVGSSCPSVQALRTELDARVARGGEAPEGLLARARTADAENPGGETRLLAVLEAVSSRLAVAAIAPSSQSWQPRPLADVWRAGVATPLELAALEAAALRAVGFAATAAVAGGEGRSLERCPALAGLDRALVAVTWDAGSLRLYDPAAPTEGGPLEFSVNRLAVSAPGPLAAAPPARPTTLRIVAAVAPDGTIKATLEFQAGGAETPHAELVRDPEKVAAGLARAAVPDAKVANVRVTSLARDRASLTASVTGALPATDALGLVRWPVAGVPAPVPPLPVASGRASPVAVPALDAAVELTLTLAPGWTVAAMPESVRVSNEIGAVVAGGRQLAGGRIEIGRRIELRRSVVPAGESARVRALLARWLAPAGRELLLRPPTGAPARPART